VDFSVLDIMRIVVLSSISTYFACVLHIHTGWNILQSSRTVLEWLSYTLLEDNCLFLVSEIMYQFCARHRSPNVFVFGIIIQHSLTIKHTNQGVFRLSVI